jgi:hypothetical protein
MRSPPFADFIPAALTLGRNASILSGGTFHAHRRSASLLLHGRKHWVIYPPNQVRCGMSYVVCRMSYVVCRMSYVVCRMSYVVCIFLKPV